MGREDDLLKKKSALNKEYEKALKDTGDKNAKKTLLDILDRLKEETDATQELLKKTGIGKTLAKLSKLPGDELKEVSEKANDLIKKWKKDMTQKKSALSKSTSQKSISQTTSQSVTPASKSSQPSSTTSSPKTPSSDAGQPRTVKTDEVTIDSTGSTPRDKTIELMYASVGLGSYADSDLLLKRAVAIESALHSEFGTVNDKYKNKARSLSLNLKNKSNPGLRETVVSGELSVEKFCTMSVEDMASEEAKARDIKLAEEALFKARGAGSAQAETDMFRCGKCRQKRCTYFQMQTRSADEPMTTFVTCVTCGNHWKFC